MMEAESISEASENFYQTIFRNNPEESHLSIRRLENLKSHKELCYFSYSNWDAACKTVENKCTPDETQTCFYYLLTKHESY
jgi:hypothetical protein